MTVPFMRNYTQLLVKTCHRRDAHAIGGMAAFIPSRRDAAVNEMAFAKVREDKEREAGDGFDGTWVAHPGLVPSPSRSSTGCSATVRTRRNASATTSRSMRAAHRSHRSRRSDNRGRGPRQRQRRPAISQCLVAGYRRRGDQQLDGGRRHRGNLPRPALAMDPQRCDHRGRRADYERALCPDPR